MEKSVLTAAVLGALSLGAPSAHAVLVTNVLGTAAAWVTDSANFALLANNGSVVSGTNDVKMVWNNQAFNASSDYIGPGSAANVTASSTAPHWGFRWTAHDIQVFTPGSYSFDTALGGGNSESGILYVTVGAAQLGMHMLFDWGSSRNIDTFVVFDPNKAFGSGLLYSTQKNTKGQNMCAAYYTGTITKNCIWDGYYYGSDGIPVKNQIWMLSSVDGNGDGIMGIPWQQGGPFQGWSVNFNANLISCIK